MRIIRAHDGDILSMQGQPNAPPNPSLEFVHAVLSEISNIPVAALVAMHATGRQVDRDSARALLQDANNDEALGQQPLKEQHDALADVEASQTCPQFGAQSEAVYLFDRELLELDLHTEDGKELLHHMDANTQDLVLEAEDDPVRQSELTLHLIASIRNQRTALLAAITNLERHRGGRQDAIKAYSHFASPVVESYRNLLAVYPMAISLTEKVRVSHKLQGQPSSNSRSSSPDSTTPKDRFLADYVSLETMQVVRDACQRTLDELERKTSELQNVLETVANGTSALKAEFHQLDMADLDAAEFDAQHAQQQLKGQISALARLSSSERNELCAEISDRVDFAVQYKNENTRTLLVSLQRIAVLQSHIANMPGLINSLNNDLRTKCDGFKHLHRLKSLVPAYVATMAEAARRRLFATSFGEIAIGFDEISVGLLKEERKRRGLYQAEWAGKLSWEIPALHDGTPSLEIRLQAGHVPVASHSQSCTLDDLKDLISNLEQIEIGQSEPAQRYAKEPETNPLAQSLSLAKAAFKGISVLQEELTATLSCLKVPSLTHSHPSLDTERSQTRRDLTILQVKCASLEEEILLEKASRQSQESSLQAAITQEKQVRSEAERLRRSAETQLDETRIQLATTREAAQATEAALATQQQLAEDLSARLHELRQQVDAEKAAAAAQSAMLASESRLRKEAEASLVTVRADLQKRVDTSTVRESDLRQELADKNAAFVALQHEHLAVSREYDSKMDQQQRAVLQAQQATQAAITLSQAELDATRAELDSREAELAELQVMCNERGKSLNEINLQNDTTAENVRKLLSICRLYFSTVLALMNAGASDRSPSDAAPSEQRSPPAVDAAHTSVVLFNDSSLEAALLSLEGLNFTQFEAGKARVQNAFAQTKKWQRECKRYKLHSEKAVAVSREKIAFRSFHPGDLALFLPTRNSSMQLFAAFNYGKPNYFLAPEGVIAEQVRTREWIVARIVSISDGVADANIATSNPYSLATGSKYFTLTAEPWRRDKGKEITASAATEPLQNMRTDMAAVAEPNSEGAIAIVDGTQATELSTDSPATLKKGPGHSQPFAILEGAVAEDAANTEAARNFNHNSVPDMNIPWSALSAQRPALISQDAALPTDSLPNASLDDLGPERPNDLVPASASSDVPAFLPPQSKALAIIPIQATSQPPPGFGATFSRSYSSNESRSPGSAALKRMSSSFLMSNIINKAGSTLSNVTIDGQASSEDWSDGKRTQTIGRYAGSRSYSARPSISAVQHAGGSSPNTDAATLLRSFTAASKSLTKRDKAAK